MECTHGIALRLSVAGSSWLWSPMSILSSSLEDKIYPAYVLTVIIYAWLFMETCELSSKAIWKL